MVELEEKGQLPLRPKARIIKTIGEELISNEIVAVLELVKNCYDAKAKQVKIKFVGPLELNEGTIMARRKVGRESAKKTGSEKIQLK